MGVSGGPASHINNYIDRVESGLDPGLPPLGSRTHQIGPIFINWAKNALFRSILSYLA